MAVGSAAALAGTLLVASGACLPDLAAPPDGAPLPPPDVLAVITPTCGDGVIDTVDSGGATDEECDPGDAGTEGCTRDCRIACDGGSVDTMGHCYFFAGSVDGFGEAQGRCGGSGRAHVVTIGTQREADFVGDAGLVDGGYWVGLSRTAFGYITFPFSEPGWPSEGNACPGCFALGPDDAGRFANIDAGTDCVAGGGERWANHACTGRELAVLCEREPAGQRIYFCNGPNCIDGLPATPKRYVLPADLVTAADAPAACAPYGRLVTLDSSEEREQLVRELVTRFDVPFTVWIGLSQTDAGAVWDDGVASRPLPWGDREPLANGRAHLAVVVGSFDTQLAHADGDEAARRLVVCQRR